MKREEYLIITFDSTQHAMAAESVLGAEEIYAKTIPTPRDITLSCGLSIMTIPDKEDKIKAMKVMGNISYKAMYRLIVEDGNRTLEIIV